MSVQLPDHGCKGQEWAKGLAHRFVQTVIARQQSNSLPNQRDYDFSQRTKLLQQCLGVEDANHLLSCPIKDANGCFHAFDTEAMRLAEEYETLTTDQ